MAVRERNKYNIDEELQEEFNFQQLRRAGRYIRRQGKLLAFAFLLNVCSILLDLCVPIFTQQTIDVFIPAKDVPGLLRLSVLFVLTIVAILFLNRQASLLYNRAGQSIIADIRHDLFAHLQKLPFDFYDSRPHGKILVRVVNYINSIANFLSNGVVAIFIELFSLVAIFCFMVFRHAGLAMLVLAGLPIFAAYMFLVKTPQRRAYQKLSNKQSNLNAYLHESINGMKVTQAFVREQYNHGIFAELCENSRSAWMRATYISSSIMPVILFLMVTFTSLIYLAAGQQWFGPISLGVTLAMIAYANRFWNPIQTLGNLYNQLITNTAYLERIFQLMDEPVSIDDREGSEPLPQITGRVVFDDVVFSYDPEVTILNHVSFTAEPGESIALVGPTGAGKSTIVSLLARFYDIKGGSVTIDGHEIGNVTIHSLRSQMGMMLQDTFLFTGTIIDNIRYGRLDATDAQVIAAAKAVRADDFISKMPEGYQTEVKERGLSLSAGQRQLISFARTLLADPRILILDEATSSIDTKTEQLVQEGLQALLKGRTSFIIAHRLSTIKNCRILYIMNGEIVESGSHDELLEKKGYYYELYTSQMT